MTSSLCTAIASDQRTVGSSGARTAVACGEIAAFLCCLRASVARRQRAFFSGSLSAAVAGDQRTVGSSSARAAVACGEIATFLSRLRAAVSRG